MFTCALSHVLVEVSPLALSSSPSLVVCVFIKAESYYTVRVCASTKDWGSAEGRGQCGVECFSSISCRGMHVRCPEFALCVRLLLIKGAFEIVSKTTSVVAWDEERLQAGGVLIVCSSPHQTPEFVGKNVSLKG